MIHGDDIYVLTNIGGTMQPVAANKSCDLEVSQDFIDACAPNEGRTLISIPTTYKWDVSCDCLMSTTQYAKMLIDAVRNGTKFTLQFLVCGFKVKGDAYIKSCNIKASKGSLAKLAVTFKTSGPLTDADGWDFINGTLFTYSNFANGTLGYTNSADYSKNGTFTEDSQTPANNKIVPPTAS